MKANFSFSNARVYGVSEAMVTTGQTFEITLDPQGEQFGKLKWFSDNDPTLRMEVREDGMAAIVSTEKTGKSTILVMNTMFKVAMQIELNVVDYIPEEATKLEITSEVLPKTESLQ